MRSAKKRDASGYVWVVNIIAGGAGPGRAVALCTAVVYIFLTFTIIAL